MMRPFVPCLGFLLACGQPASIEHPATGGDGIVNNATLADPDDYRPTYGKAELKHALLTERAAEATAVRDIDALEAKGDDDALRVALADLAVRRRFIATLEACAAGGKTCPPRLDDPPWTFDIAAEGAKPPLDSPLRFDLEDWQKIAAELHGRACACRTIACVDSLDVAIGQLETRPMPDVQGDDAASASITHARECLMRLRMSHDKIVDGSAPPFGGADGRGQAPAVDAPQDP